MTTIPPSQRYSFSFRHVTVELQEAWKAPTRGVQLPNLLDQGTWKKIENFYTSIFTSHDGLLPQSPTKLSEIGCSQIEGEHFLNTFFEKNGIYEHKSVQLTAAQVADLEILRSDYPPLMMEVKPPQETSTLKFRARELSLPGLGNNEVAVEINRKIPDVIDPATLANVGAMPARQKGLINFPHPSECETSWFSPDKPHTVRVFHDVDLNSNSIKTKEEELFFRRYPLHFQVNANLQKIDKKQAPFCQHFKEALITTGDKDKTAIFLQQGYEVTVGDNDYEEEKAQLIEGIARQMKRYLSIQQKFSGCGKKEITIKDSLGDDSFDEHIKTCTSVFIRIVAIYVLNTFLSDDTHQTQVNLDLETGDDTPLSRKITDIRKRIINFQKINRHATVNHIIENFLDMGFQRELAL